MSNKMIEDIEKLDEVIDNIDNKELDSAKDKLVVWRDDLKKELEAMELYFTKHEQLDLPDDYAFKASEKTFDGNTGHATESVQVMGVTGYDNDWYFKSYNHRFIIYSDDNIAVFGQWFKGFF